MAEPKTKWFVFIDTDAADAGEGKHTVRGPFTNKEKAIACAVRWRKADYVAIVDKRKEAING